MISVNLRVPGSNQHGRAFFHAERFTHPGLSVLESELGRVFAEEDDLARLILLERALSCKIVTVETYRGESPPHELHAYVRMLSTPIFACVLATTADVARIVESPPYVILETSTFQVIDEDPTTAIETWIRRVWPKIKVPSVYVAPAALVSLR